MSEGVNQVLWDFTEVKSPLVSRPVSVVAARGVPYLENGNRLQTLNMYLPISTATRELVGHAVSFLPLFDSQQPTCVVHVHGGAWRDPGLTATSVEPAVAVAFSDFDQAQGIRTFASINYTVSPWPDAPPSIVDSEQIPQLDPARQAIHPKHVSDVLSALAYLRKLGLVEHSYVLTSHSCGACIAFQSILAGPAYFGLNDVADAPCPAAIIGLNGLYDLPALIDDSDAAHASTREDYTALLTEAFGNDKSVWSDASPARIQAQQIERRVNAGSVSRLIMLDQSRQDQLVPFNQLEKFEQKLQTVEGVRVVRGHRCTGLHTTPWEQGGMLWTSVQDALHLLSQQ